jgi:NAD(P)-dependent dehydrogenase (short-subunit alcohol dehydrogenase family)
MDLGLTDRVVLVTGGSDGLGLATADRLVREGAQVAVCGRDQDKLARAADQLGRDALVVRADVTDPAALTELFGAIRDRWGKLDGLVNNAGAAAGKPFEDIDDDAWAADLELKLYATIRAIRLALPLLRESDAAAIVNVVSIAPKAPTAMSMPSAVSRSGQLTLTKVLSLELAPGIRVNAALAGFLESGQWERSAARTGRTVAEEHARIVEALMIPAGRLGRPEEFGDAVAFLLSARASYISGVALNIDGALSPVV